MSPENKNDCKELATCTEIIIVTKGDANKIVYLNTIIPAVGFNTIVHRGIHHFHHIADIGIGGQITLRNPNLESPKIVLLGNIQDINQFNPDLILTHEGRVFSEIDSDPNNPDFIPEKTFLMKLNTTISNIPDTLKIRFDYLDK